jgi:prepilin-type processing-associated H-X9-DG protein
VASGQSREPAPQQSDPAATRAAGDAILRGSCLRSLLLSALSVAAVVTALVWGLGRAHAGQQSACMANQAALARALRTYALDNDERFPPVEADWRRGLMPILDPRADTLLGLPSRYWACPAVTSAVFYERNAALSSLRLSDIGEGDQPRVIAVWESQDGVSVAYPHPGGAVYGFVDGHARAYGRDADASLLWSPQGSGRPEPR